jgi:D-3-phosphoglycerate dehydrogenase
MKKIVVCDAIHQKGFDLLRSESDLEIVDAVGIDKRELLDIVKDADLAITRSSTDVDDKFLNAVESMCAVVRAGVGVDNVDIEGCSKKGIVVMNVPTANTIAAVELTMTHMLSCARSFPYAHAHLKNERIWKREKWYGTELNGKKLGIIGFGNIGSRVGIRSKAFDMDVVTYDPYINPNKATDLGIAYTTNFDDILSCDIITIHTPKNQETIDMISHDEIAKMKEGVILINCARGGLYNEEALFDGLTSGKIRFAGIDVFSKEPATDHKLLDLDNVTVTPHLGANTLESQEKIALQAAETAIQAVRGMSFPNALNLPIKESEIPSYVKPYLELTQKLGYFAAQATKKHIVSLKVKVEGEIEVYHDSLGTFALVGALSESLGENINYVNAEYVAKERGVVCEFAKQTNSSAYKNKVTVILTTDDGVFEVAGTVFGEDHKRIVSLNGFAMDIEPKGRMLLFQNTDKPGVIADVSRILCQNGINIADFRLGRDGKGRALAVVIVDESIQKPVMQELDALEACLWVSSVVL